MSFLLKAEANRTKDYTILIRSPSGGKVQLQATDVVRVKIGRMGSVTLDLDDNATSNGSSVTVSNVGDGSSVDATAILRLNQADTLSFLGMYKLEVNVVDDSDSDLIKAVESGSIFFERSLDGDTGLT